MSRAMASSPLRCALIGALALSVGCSFGLDSPTLVVTPRILAVTASTLEEQELKSRAVGMDGFITKPIGIEQLKATLDVWLKDARSDLEAERME